MLKTILVSLFCWFCFVPTFACNKIVVLGDSLSAAHGIEKNQGWVALLQKRLEKTNPNVTLINASVGGDTTQEGLLRVPLILKEHNPCLVIVELGGNDGLRGIAIKEIKKNLSKIIEHLQAAKVKILLLGVRLPPNYGPEYVNQFQAIFVELGKEYGVAVVPQILKGVADDPKLMQGDGVHPTAAGQPKVLENVWEALTVVIPSERSERKGSYLDG